MSFIAQPSVVLALVAALENDSNVSAMASGTVYDWELPVPEDNSMPVLAVVVKQHGGPASPATLEMSVNRILIQCFGPTMNLADQLHFACYLALKNLPPSNWNQTNIKSCVQTAGPTPGRDPVLQWPYNTSLWIVRASDLSVP